MLIAAAGSDARTLGPGDDAAGGVPAAGADLGGGHHAALGARRCGPRRRGCRPRSMRCGKPMCQTQAAGSRRPEALGREASSTRSPPSPRQAETVLATFTSRRDAALTVPSADRKAALVAAAARSLRPNSRRWRLGTPAEDLRPPLSVARFHPRAAISRNARRQGGLPRPASGAGGPDRRQADPRGAGRADAAEPGRHLHGRPEARPAPARAVAALCAGRAGAVHRRRWAASATGRRWR